MGDTTKPRQVRVADGLWEAYRLVCEDDGVKRAEDLNAYMRRRVKEHGDPEALRLLGEAVTEVAERRARMHPGRPPKATPEA